MRKWNCYGHSYPSLLEGSLGIAWGLEGFRDEWWLEISFFQWWLHIGRRRIDD